MKKVELLAPVRDETTFVVAINAGANAVYFGLGELNMRASSKGIEIKELPRMVKLAHQQGVNIYVTLNVIVYEKEIKQVEALLRKCKKVGVDAIICWDISVIHICQKLNIPFHISTQANISNSIAAQFYEKLGASCLVLARECTLEQIKAIKKKTQAKIEIFVHGAMCVSVSGRCFMSQFLSNKSANRGACTQPCRRSYIVKDKETGEELDVHNNFIMSPKDLCTIGMVDTLIKTGVDTFKIEGRSRSAEYISTVVGAYRKAIDAYYAKKYTLALKRKLLAEVSYVYHRGFSTGFLHGTPAEKGWAGIHGSAATEKKEYVGKVIHYFDKAQIAHIQFEASQLQSGDDMYIQGPTTGSQRIRVLETQEEMWKKKKSATIPCSVKVRTGDMVFKIVKIRK